MKAALFPFFSVVIPTYNRCNWFEKSLSSVLNQNYKNFEVIVVDDGSTDDTFSELLKWQKQFPKFKIIQQKNMGVSAARNTAIRVAEAPWIAFLDSDDEWVPEKLELCHEALKDSPLKVLHSNETWVRNGKIIKQNFIRTGGNIFQESVKRCCIGPSTSVIHQDVFKKVGYFRPDFIISEDYELWLRICAIYQVEFIEKSLVIKHGHDSQLSFSNHSADLWRLKALHFQLWNPFINSEDRQLIIEEIGLKRHILAKGFEKHQNLTGLNEMNAILELVQAKS